jgi:hypothetical protein
MEKDVRVPSPDAFFLDRPDISSGEALAGIMRTGRAGSNTTADHITVLDLALANLPEGAQPGQPDGPALVARGDSAGATHGFAEACRARGVGFSVGFPIGDGVRDAIKTVPDAVWDPAVEPDDGTRDGAWVAEITGLVDLSEWPVGSRLIVRKERPHRGPDPPSESGRTAEPAV